LDEDSFWSALEWRVCRDFAGMRDGHLRDYWCDGFSSGWLRLDEVPQRIEGTAWIGDRRTLPVEWKYTVVLTRPVASRDDVDWESLLPAENTTRWLSLDPRRKRLEIDMSAAVPDGR
jgi:hypothetical protein